MFHIFLTKMIGASVLIFILLCIGKLGVSLGDDVHSTEYSSDSGLPTDYELQCADHHCCSYDQELSTHCPLSSLPAHAPSMIFPGGSTRCLKSTSTPYAFQVYPGSPSHLLFYFQGGGSCWDDHSTNSSGRGKTSGTYCRTDAVPWPVYGVFDKQDQRNAYKAYTIVNVLYCSGDNHAGGAMRDYQDEEGINIEQRGAANTAAVIDWVVAQQLTGDLSRELDDFVVMGCSAGALASQIWANELIKLVNYPKSSAVVADSYLGVFPGSIEGSIMFSMGICSLHFLSEEFRSQCLEKNATTAEFVMSAMGNQPNVPYLFLQSRTDRVQVKYYNFLAEQYSFASIDGDEFEEMADETIQKYNTYSNFIGYFVNSNQHCYTPTPYLYVADTNGRNVFANGDNSTADIDLYEETMNRLLTRLPLDAGASISSQCSDEDCSLHNITPKTFFQPAIDQGGGDGGYVVNTGDEYEPSARVRGMHGLPRYDAAMTRVSSEFNFNMSTSDDPWSDAYMRSIVPLPVIIYLSGAFSVMVFCFYLLLRRAMGHYAYAQTSYEDLDEVEDQGNEEWRDVKSKSSRTPSCVLASFQLMLLLAFVANVLIFVGDVGLEAGADTADSALSHIESSLTSASEVSDSLSILGGNVTSLLTEMGALGCDGAGVLASYSSEFEAVVEDMSALVTPVFPYVRKSRNVLESWVHLKKNRFIWIAFSLNSLCAGVFYWAARRKSGACLQVAVVLTMVVLLLNMAFGVLYMMSLMAAADFCITPSTYTLALTPPGSTRDSLRYLSSCTGYCSFPINPHSTPSPLDATTGLTCHIIVSTSGLSPTATYTSDTEYTINTMQYFLGYLASTQCTDSEMQPLAAQVQWNLDQISADFATISDLSACNDYMPRWHAFFYDGVCSSAFDGMYLIWITQSLCAACLFAAALCAVSLPAYFVEQKMCAGEGTDVSDVSCGSSGQKRGGAHGVTCSEEAHTQRDAVMSPLELGRV